MNATVVGAVTGLIAPKNMEDERSARRKASAGLCVVQAGEGGGSTIKRPWLNAVEEASDRRVLFADEEFIAQVLAHLDAQHAQTPILKLTFDVFDTVVLRNHKSEARRFWEIAGKQADLLNRGTKASKRRMSGADLFIARLMATRACYRLRRPVSGCREGSLRDIYAGLVGVLGIDRSHADALIDVEIQYEADNLSPNPLALRMAEWAQRVGATTTLISDMYMHGDQIDRLLLTHFGERRSIFGATVSSADTVISKRSGLLFDHLAKQAQTAPAGHLHVGDSVGSDFRGALRRGWRALLLPIPRRERGAIEADHNAFLAERAAEGLDVGEWIKSGV